MCLSVCVCVCTCICVRGFPCTYAWAELYYGMRFCSWCHFRLKEVKESLHCVPRSATQEFLIKPIVSKLHKLNCREQDSVCVPQDPVYILTFQHQFIQCPDIQFCFFFVLFFCCWPFYLVTSPFKFALHSDSNDNKRYSGSRCLICQISTTKSLSGIFFC